LKKLKEAGHVRKKDADSEIGQERLCDVTGM
jgi:hypothetical protein